ncbi:MerR family transcriptional regulator [Streptomyces sp. KM273126]|uniref:MerR family transcriptional regulator n=1 Tax=Actinomycetes TaxID=1760 RepID=UPI00103D9202|nr:MULTISPECIES: MerR family transcriptional regulator [Actinomycetes]MBA2808976.1 MerR family transcriptional regulator [Streptomyces sp. KM273126]MBR8745511.1 MerR family transcriptional regulator [Nocardiopsis sp. MG754419]
MRIGELASRAKVSTRALRYYEEQGILSSERTPSGQRHYPESAVDRVRLIQQLYAAGLGSRMIASFLPCIDAKQAGPEMIERLRAERARITASAAELEEAGRKLDLLIELAAHPGKRHCPASLDAQSAGGDVAPA